MTENKIQSLQICRVPLGNLAVMSNGQSITRICFMEDGNLPAESPDPITRLAVQQLQEYFQGTLCHFSFLVSPEGTSFRRKVWENLLQIPFGERITYTRLTERLGNASAIRAVAGAVAANPILIVIPCHRVVGQSGRLTGYAGGLERKRWLLEHERLHSVTVHGTLF